MECGDPTNIVIEYEHIVELLLGFGKLFVGRQGRPLICTLKKTIFKGLSRIGLCLVNLQTWLAFGSK